VPDGGRRSASTTDDLTGSCTIRLMAPDVELTLTAEERAMLNGDEGRAPQLAMEIVSAMARISGARRLVPISSAHVDGCLYHGTVGLDFAEQLAAAGGTVRVPTTLNVSSLDLLHPELVKLDTDTRRRARRLMDAYVELGCQPSWTCAPYQLPGRPAFGEHVCWAESNAIVFANSVLGARTERYGDFIDICAALTGRTPLAGLHLSRRRRARLVVEIDGLRPAAFEHDELYALIGCIVGHEAGGQVPAIVGLPPSTTEDQLKQVGAAAASSGRVAMFHAVGITPEAPTLEAALGGAEVRRVVRVGPPRLRAQWHALSTNGTEPLGAVSVGTPHFSLSELHQLEILLAGRQVHPSIDFYVSTARHTLADIERGGQLSSLSRAGITFVTDTCTYVTPVMRSSAARRGMTNSAKWAWYAPANLGVEVTFGTLADCVESGVAGRVVREQPSWLDG
jgi:predicted aconitase